MQSLSNHVVNGAHDQRINLNGHGLINSIVNHADKAVKLRSVRKALLDLHFGERHRHFKSDLAVEELSRHFRLVENIGVIRLAICQLPRTVFGSIRNVSLNLLDHRAKLPRIHHNRRNIAGVRTIDENHLADMIHKGLHIIVNTGSIENLLTNVNHVGQILSDNISLAKDFTSNLIHKVFNLNNSHKLYLTIFKNRMNR